MSKKLVNLALKTLDCSQKELAEKLEVSAGQISKWKKHNDYMSFEIEKKIREICQIGDLAEELILRSGSLENAKKWDELFRYIADFVLTECEASWECGPLIDYEDMSISAAICEVLVELGIVLTEQAPKIPNYNDDDAFDDFFKNLHVKLIRDIFIAYTEVYDFFGAYFSYLSVDENTSENMLCLESNFLALAACKVDLDPKVAPKFNNFKRENLGKCQLLIEKIKFDAVRNNLPLEEELAKFVYQTGRELSDEAEREALGFNGGRVHPDIYINELLTSMRMIHQVLPVVLEKLEIEFELDESELTNHWNAGKYKFVKQHTNLGSKNV